MRTSKSITSLIAVSLLLISCQQEEKPGTNNNDSPNRTDPHYAYIAGTPIMTSNKIYRANPQNGSGTTVTITESNIIKTVGIDENLYTVYYTYTTGSDIYLKTTSGSDEQLLDNLSNVFDPEEIEWCNGGLYGFKANDLTLYSIVISGGATATPCPNSMFTGLTKKSTKKTLCKQGTTLYVITGNPSGGTSLTLYTLNTSTGVASGATTLSGGTGFSFASTANINSYYAGSTLYVSISDGGVHSLWTLSGSTLVAAPSPSGFGVMGTDCSYMPACCS